MARRPAIFSSVYSLMLKPLPYQEPEQIVELYTSAAKAGHNGVEEKSGNPFVYQMLPPQARPGGLTMFLRTNRPTGDAVTALRDKVRAIDALEPAVRSRRAAGSRGLVL